MIDKKTVMRLKTKLLDERDNLNERLNAIKTSHQRPVNADWSEQAQERENDEVIDALGNEIVHRLEAINTALYAMDEETYGLCVGCGCEIPIARLENLPYTNLCVKCAT